MVSTVEVAGLQSFARLSRNLRATGEQGKGMKREVTKSLNRETKTTRKKMRNAIVPALPHTGGLAQDVLSSTRFTTTVSTGRNPGVRIRARGKRSIRRMNKTGTVRHPVYGNRDQWVTQSAGIVAGFLDEPFEAARPELQRAVLLAVNRINSRF